MSRLIQPAPGAEVEEELRFHLEERVRELEARGLDPSAARAAALERLGDLEAVKAECVGLLASERRTERRRQWAKVSWLDFKLGLRMLVKYPGLTIVGALAMAFAIWVGAGTFEFVTQVLHPSLPLHEGDRVVGIHLWDASAGRIERRAAYELAAWRGELRTIEGVGGFRTLDRNLITGDGRGEPVEVAELTASAFDVTRVAPLLGRTLVAADESPGAADVVVIGYDVWQRRFAGDPGVVGRSIRLGRARPTVVGVMPEGFHFPIAQSLWMPLRSASAPEPRSATPLRLFGRLAPGASLEDAQAELTALGRRAAADHPETHAHLRPRVMPYGRSILYLPSVAVLGLASINLPVLLLLVLICGNVALLMFARAATREGEILVRSALGASRARITGQLFAEALVLGGIAAAMGLAAAGLGLRWLFSTVIAELAGQRLPFWFAPSLSPATIGYALLLTLLAAAVAGVVPALKVTGRRVDPRLRQVAAGGGGLRFGGVWTAVIVVQVAVTVAVPSIAFLVRHDAAQIRDHDPGVAAAEYLSVRLEMDRETSYASGVPGWADDLAGPGSRDMADELVTGDPAVDAPTGDSRGTFMARYRASAEELEARLEARPEIAAVTFGERLPLMYHPHRLVDVDSGGAAPLRPEWPAYRVSSVFVSRDYFDVLEAPILNGRGFHSGDLAPDARTVIVNESFVARVLGGRNPLGRHVRYVAFEEERGPRDPEAEPWYEIVGVAPDLGLSVGQYDPKVSGIYHPTVPGGVYPMHMAVHAAGSTGELAHELRTLATAVEPGLRLYDPMPLDQVDESELRFYAFWFWILVLVCGIALVLALAGIYAVMSFAVSRRTREIGIRVALGGGRARVVTAILRRPLTQVGLGLVMGGALIAALLGAGWEGLPPTGWVLGFVAYLVVMTGIFLTACVVPTRRALRVEPTEALRADG